MQFIMIVSWREQPLKPRDLNQAHNEHNACSFIHSGYFYSAFSIPLLLWGAPDTARILYRSFTPKRYRELRVKDLPKVLSWRLERDSNPRPFGRKATNVSMSHHAPHVLHSGL